MRVIFQTLKDLRNYSEVLRDGPYECIKDNAWLHSGFYFWDGPIKLAHFWGKAGYHDEYMILRSSYEINSNVFDLIDDLDHLELFRETYFEMKKIDSDLIVRDVIEFIIETMGMDFDAIRAEPKETFSKGNYLYERIKFTKFGNTRAYIELYPAKQICFRKKECFEDKPYELVYATHKPETH